MRERTGSPAPRLRLFTLGDSLGSGYARRDALHDLKAGVNVALVAFPQGMAYALIAGVPIEYGIFGAAVAAMVAPLLASSRLTVLGPTNATAVLLATGLAGVTAASRVPAMALMVALAGLFLVAGALLRLSSVLRYVSRAVMIGYVTAAALLIVAKQLQAGLGYGGPGTDGGFLETVRDVFANAGRGHAATIACAGATALVYLFLERRVRALPAAAVTLASMTVLVRELSLRGMISGIATLPSLTPGSWPLTVPAFGAGAISQLMPAAAVLAFLCALESSMMARTLASRTGERLDADQDLLACGTVNVACAFFGGMPASCSLTRSALNATSGARTPLSSLVSGLLCGVFGLAAGAFIGWVPLPSLAVVVILVALSLISPRQIRAALGTTRADATVLVMTFTGSLLVRLDFGILLGVAASIYLYLEKASHPEIVEYGFDEGGELAELEGPGDRNDPRISIVHAEGDVFFGSAELVRTEVERVAADPRLKIIVLRLKNARHLDLTSVHVLEELVRFLRSTGRDLIVSGATEEVYRVLQDSGFVELLGRENVFAAAPRSPKVASRNALRRAEELLRSGNSMAGISSVPAVTPKDR